MRVLIADDDALTRLVLRESLEASGYSVQEVTDGADALVLLRDANPPSLAIVNWMMPGVDGVEVCRRMRGSPGVRPVYIILLTAREETVDIVEGLTAGADDYVTKPFDSRELRARVQVGERVVGLQTELARRVGELEEALSHVRRLQGLLPICTYCKRIRDDRNYWQSVEAYVGDHSEARFSHSVCPDCHARFVEPMLSELDDDPQGDSGGV